MGRNATIDIFEETEEESQVDFSEGGFTEVDFIDEDFSEGEDASDDETWLRRMAGQEQGECTGPTNQVEEDEGANMEFDPGEDFEEEAEEAGCRLPHVGMLFPSMEAGYAYVRQYGKLSRCKLSVVKSDDKLGKARFECHHGKVRASRSKGVRPDQQTCKKGCPFFIQLRLRKSIGNVVISNCNLNHEFHVITEELYQRDSACASEEAVEVIKNMSHGNCKVTHIQQALSKKNIKLTSDQIRYQLLKLNGLPREDEELQDLIRTIKEEGGDVQLKIGADGKIQALTVVTEKMRKAYHGTRPTVIQVKGRQNASEKIC